MFKNFTPAANKTIILNDKIFPVQYFSDTKFNLFSQYCKENPFHNISESTFKRRILEFFKTSKKLLDLCENCELGKNSEQKI